MYLNNILGCIVLLSSSASCGLDPPQPEDKPSLTDLPVELVETIARNLGTEDLSSLKIVTPYFYHVISGKRLLGEFSPISLVPQNGKLAIPSVYHTIQVLGDTSQKTINSWSRYLSVTHLSLATTTWPIPTNYVSSIRIHFPNLERLTFQTPWDIPSPIIVTDGAFAVKYYGFDFKISVPIALARLTVKLFKDKLETTLTRIKSLPQDIRDDTALTLDFAATRLWQIIGLGKVHKDPSDIDYISEMIIGSVSTRDPFILKTRLGIIRLILGNDALSFRSWALFEDIKAIIQNCKLKKQKFDEKYLILLVSTLSELKPYLRAHFIRTLARLGTTSEKFKEVLNLINSPWLSPLQKSLIIKDLNKKTSIGVTPEDRKSLFISLKKGVKMLDIHNDQH